MYARWWIFLSISKTTNEKDQGGNMNKINMDELEVQVYVTYKGQEWDNFDVSDVTLESIYDDIKQQITTEDQWNKDQCKTNLMKQLI